MVIKENLPNQYDSADSNEQSIRSNFCQFYLLKIYLRLDTNQNLVFPGYTDSAIFREAWNGNILPKVLSFYMYELFSNGFRDFVIENHNTYRDYL